MNLQRIIRGLTPPALACRIGRIARERRELETFCNFYGAFLTSGDLCFDVGANLGNRTRCFRHLGCKVVCVEPQASCFRQLQRRFGRDPGTVLVHKALGSVPGRATLQVSPDHVLSTLSQAFIDRTSSSGRFATARWDRAEDVAVTTLDQLVAEHGIPKFIKIDVEGYESEVLAGLSCAVPALSIEWTPELSENARRCLRHLAELGAYEFNVSWGESMRFYRPHWRSVESMLALIDEMDGEAQLFGDIYARVKA